MKAVYFQKEKTPKLIEWLKTLPEGELKVLIGIGPDEESKIAVDEIEELVKKEGREFGRWVADKMSLGELDIACADREIVKIPEGVVFDKEKDLAQYLV